MKMNTNPVGWTIPAELPPAFALPKEFRKSLPNEIQQWLNSVEKRIDGLTLRRIEEEATELYDAHGTDIVETSTGEDDLYRLGRRLFYTRMQEIVDIMFPGRGIEVGVDLLWMQGMDEVPGGAVSDAVADGENINRVDLSGAGASR